MSQEAKIIISTILVTLFIMAGGIFFFSKSEKNIPPTNVLAQNAKHTITSKDAKITIVEFADFQCPACAAAHPAIKQILAEYKGQINFSYRHFPLPQHANAIPAAQAAEAAAAQGKFWEMYDLLYQNQNEWSESNNSTEFFIRYAKKINLDTNIFSKEITNNTYSDVIQKDKDDGVTIGVNSTPTIFINGKKIQSFPSYTVLKEAIERERTQ